MKSLFVAANGIRVHYLEWGGSGPPVILVHGLYDDARVWSRLAPLLAAKHRVIAVDRRGAGQTDKPTEGYDHETLARDLEAFLQALKLDSVTLIAHSFGGEIALTASAISPDRISSLVLVEGGFFPKRDVSSQKLLPAPPCKAPPAECARYAALEKAIKGYDAEKLYARVAAPTLLLFASPPARMKVDSSLLEGIKQHLTNVAEKKLRSGKVQRIENAGHWIQKDQPKAMAEAIESFLGR